MQLLYNLYYRQYGIRRLQQLFSPRLFRVDEFSFPKNATFHYVSHDETDLAPNQEQPYFHAYRKRIFMDVVSELTETKGNARRNSTPPQILYRPFFLKNRLFKFTRDAATVNKDPSTLTAIDYAYLQKLYRYTKMPLTPYYQWYNIEKTVWDNIRKIAQESERQNFVFFKVPDIIPSLTALRMYSNKVNNAILRVFDTHEKRFILELWKWIDPETREASLLGQYTQEELDKVNLVLMHNERWCVLNLGQFNKWRREPKHQDEEEVVQEVTDKSQTPVVNVGYYPPQFQKLMLKLFISIQAQSIADDDHPEVVEVVEGSEVKTTDHQTTDTDELADHDESEIEPIANKEIAPVNKNEIDKSEKIHELAPDLDIVESGRLDLDETLFDELEKDLEALEFIEQKSLMLKGVTKRFDDEPTKAAEPIRLEVPKEISFEVTPEEHQILVDKIYVERSADASLKDYINRHAEYGLMSAADYRKLTKQAEEFMTTKAPYKPDVPIHQFIKIQEHEIKIAHEETTIPHIETVPDKGMLQSSLIAFDSKYIKNVLPKDITAMIVNIQKAGIIVNDYQIEHEHNALGSYEIHTLKVKPIDGVASTLRFKIPTVDEEGNFIANGNKYHMRKQRGD